MSPVAVITNQLHWFYDDDVFRLTSNWDIWLKITACDANSGQRWSYSMNSILLQNSLQSPTTHTTVINCDALIADIGSFVYTNTYSKMEQKNMPFSVIQHEGWIHEKCKKCSATDVFRWAVYKSAFSLWHHLNDGDQQKKCLTFQSNVGCSAEFQRAHWDVGKLCWWK